MNPHTAILNRTMVALSEMRDVIVRVWQNPCGQGVVGRAIQRITRKQVVEVYPGDYIVRGGQIVKYGLVPGSGDLIAEVSTIIEPHHVGRRMGVFASFEGKTGTGRMSDDQRAWHEARKAAGSISVEVREAKDGAEGIRRWLEDGAPGRT